MTLKSSKVMKLWNDDHTSNSSGLLATDGEDYEGERFLRFFTCFLLPD